MFSTCVCVHICVRLSLSPSERTSTWHNTQIVNILRGEPKKKKFLTPTAVNKTDKVLQGLSSWLGLPALTDLVIKWHLIICPADAGYLTCEPWLTMGFGNKEVFIGELSLETVSIWAMQREWEQNLIITLFSLPSPWHQYSIIVPHPQCAAKHAPTHVQCAHSSKIHFTSVWHDSSKRQIITLMCVCVFVCKRKILMSKKWTWKESNVNSLNPVSQTLKGRTMVKSLTF